MKQKKRKSTHEIREVMRNEEGRVRRASASHVVGPGPREPHGRLPHVPCAVTCRNRSAGCKRRSTWIRPVALNLPIARASSSCSLAPARLSLTLSVRAHALAHLSLVPRFSRSSRFFLLSRGLVRGKEAPYLSPLSL
jgi:hypothetical protein